MQINKNFNLTKLNSLNCPAIARDFYLINDFNQLNNLADKVIILGGGNNIIFKTKNIDFPVIKIINQQIKIIAENQNYITIKVNAGKDWQQLVSETVDNNWQGLENLALIPGTVGASPIQNIGAYGAQVADFIKEVIVFDLHEKKIITFQNKDCLFGYRNSIFKQYLHRYLIISVIFKLNKNHKLNLTYFKNNPIINKLTNPKNIFDYVCELREKKLPDPKIFPNVGSFFHNPVIGRDDYFALQKDFPDLVGFLENNQAKVSAGFLLEKAGFKGKKIGNILISPQHSLVLINNGATGEEILHVADLIKQKIKEMFNINLTIEPIII